MTTFDTLFGSHRFMIILRDLSSASECVNAAHRAWDAGIELVEVPIRSPEHVPSLAAVVAAGAERGKRVGAGTVLTADQVNAAVATGASYTVAPGFDPDVMAVSVAAGLPHLPGVATPTEVQRARKSGCHWMKVFPAAALGPTWLKSIRGPFPDVNYLATGGISPNVALEFLAAGARIVAFGVSIIEPHRKDELLELVAGEAGV